MPETFKIKAENFEGPLDLILELVEKRKFFIGDLSLSKITEDFITYIESRGKENVEIDTTSHFIFVAATLLLIKSKSLLPELTLTEEEKEDIEELNRRLAEFAIIRKGSVELRKIYGINRLFMRKRGMEAIPVFSPGKDGYITKAGVFSSIQTVLQEVPKKAPEKERVHVGKTISLEEMVTSLKNRITNNLKTTFKELSREHSGNKVHIIVSFLALLELFKDGFVRLSQNEDTIGADIHIETNNISVPKYN